MLLLAVTKRLQELADSLKLSLFLSISDNRVRNRAAKPVGNDRRGSMPLGFSRFGARREPRKNVAIQHLGDNCRDSTELLLP